MSKKLKLYCHYKQKQGIALKTRLPDGQVPPYSYRNRGNDEPLNTALPLRLYIPVQYGIPKHWRIMVI
jgi:hypothetical protein